jgi:integrase
MDKKSRTFEFTKQSVQSLQPPTEDVRVDYYDSKLTGLQLRVSKTGRKTFRIFLKRNGKHYFKTLGTFPEVSLTAVRAQAAKHIAAIQLGQFEKKEVGAQPTVGEVFQAYLTYHQFNPDAPKADAAKVQRQFDRFIFSRIAFCRLDATALEIDDCVPVIRAAMERGNTTGNNLLRNAKAAINWGMKAPANPRAPAEFSYWKLRFNPFAQMQLQPSSNEQDDRYLSPDELTVAYNLIDEEPQPYREMLRFLFLSGGIRLRQLTRLSWDDIDEQNMTMRLRDIKGRRAQARIYSLPITPLMLQTLHRANPGDKPLSNGLKTADEEWLRRVGGISNKMNGAHFTAKHIRKTGWSLIRDIPVDAKRYWLSDDMSTIAQKHYDFFDHRDDILSGMLQWQAMCEGNR